MRGRAIRMELWGGLECTMARVGDDIRDQIAETGHDDRPADLDLLADLGLRTLRYPVLWERVRPALGGPADWRWHDERLGRMRDLGIAPVAGLIHHGSGPRGTHLLDPDFPTLFAAYAGAVARRYPWIDRYVPVNEPLTTARFSGLYGHWYPHRRDDRAFLRALVNQCRATVLAMRAIRRVNPAAQLVQTEDLGRTFSTPRLAGQAAYENERRWLTFDLLFGRIDRHHPWHAILRRSGIAERELDALAERESIPDIVGINHYLTSERYLDERLGRYPEGLHGGNGRERYADAEAVRVALPPGEIGPAARLREAWARYETPIAVTEAHHGCSRDEQLRWLLEVWRDADRVRREGADIRAVTAWALFGSTDWTSLLTRREGIYEPGAFDARALSPRPTALAVAIGRLARRGRYDHPVLDGPGWWKRPGRFYGPGPTRPDRPPAGARTLLIRDSGSALGRTLARVAAERGLAFRSLHPDHESEPVDEVWALVDCVAGLAPARRRGRALPRLVFAADDAPDPSPSRPGLLHVRLGHPFGPAEPDGFVSDLLCDVAEGRRPARGGDAPALSYLPDVAHVALDLLVDGASGSFALISAAPVSRRTLAAVLAARLGSSRRLSGMRLPLSPPASPDGYAPLPSLESALDRYVADLAFPWRPAVKAVRAVG